MSTSDTPAKVKGLVVATRYATVRELVAALHPFADDTSIFIASSITREVGVESPFAILLADRTPAILGWCVVHDAWPDPETSPHQRPGMRVGLHRLTPESEHVLALVQAERAARQVRDAAVPATGPARRTVTVRIPALTALPAKRTSTAALPAIVATPTAPGAPPAVRVPPPTASRLSPTAFVAAIRSRTSDTVPDTVLVDQPVDLALETLVAPALGTLVEPAIDRFADGSQPMSIPPDRPAEGVDGSVVTARRHAGAAATSPSPDMTRR